MRIPKIQADGSAEDVRRLFRFLEERGVFTFDVFETGLFPAVGRGSRTERTSGYRSVWVRDNVHIAWAHFVTGRRDVAIKNLQASRRFFETQSARFDAAIASGGAPTDPSDRPHIRFDGETGEEIPVRWPHAQNDALGAFVWLLCSVYLKTKRVPEQRDVALLNRFIRYFEAISFWKDEDSGHWEEEKKISASSIGVVTAALGQVCRLFDAYPEACGELQKERAERLVGEGERALSEMLPWECVQKESRQHRRYDAALLFLADPFDVLTASMTEKIVDDVVSRLQGAHGVRRYLLDSYWGPDYRTVPPRLRAADFSEQGESRDRFAVREKEAQWTLFDPILSILFGRRYRERSRKEDLEMQIHYLNRSLSQLIDAPDGSGRAALPEANFWENGRCVPNDHVPLQWAHANLLRAVCAVRESLGD